MEIRAATASEEETGRLGERLGARLFPGAVVTLSGGLGAGKTALVRGICRGAGCETRASSPSYALMHRYGGPIPVCHFDLYRVEPGDPWVGMEVEEAMDGRNIVLIEWPGPAGEILPPERLDIWIESGEDPDRRELRLMGIGAAWESALEGWVT